MLVAQRGLVVFDLDGTLIRSLSACELLARGLGRAERMRQFEALSTPAEIAQARLEMAAWYADYLPNTGPASGEYSSGSRPIAMASAVRWRPSGDACLASVSALVSTARPHDSVATGEQRRHHLHETALQRGPSRR